MLIEQIIEFELKWTPWSYMFSLKLVIFVKKQTYPSTNLQMNCYLLHKNIVGGHVPCIPTPGTSHLKNLTPKCKILSVY